MTPRHAFLILTIAAAPVLIAAEPPIEFSAVLTADGKTRVALTNKATNATTWLEPGDQFNGYTIARYDAETEAVFLKKDGEETRLGLVHSKTPDTAASAAAAPALSGTASTTASAVRSNLRRLAAAARHYQLAREVMSVSYSDLVGPGKPIAALTPVAGEDYSSLTFGPNVTAVSVTTADGNTVTLDVSPQTSAAASAAAAPAAPTATAPPSTTTPPPPASPDAATTAPAPTGRTNEVAEDVTDTANHTDATPPAPNVSPQQPAAPVSPTSPIVEGDLPPTRQPPAMSYTIREGDTLRSIAQEHGVTIHQLESLNPRATNAGSLPAGATIRIR